ncbi:hypothetical protein GCM10027566_30280 [Arachidicoccus ginsenosidivorans]
MVLNNNNLLEDLSKYNPLLSIFNELELLDNDSLWKFFSEENLKLLAKFILKDRIPGLDYSRMEIVNKEIQNITLMNFNSQKRYVDKLVKIYRKADPTKFILLHIEFQTEANKAFAERSGLYNIRLRVNNDCTIVTIAIVHRAAANYKHMHQFDKRNNGTLVRYQGYIIDQMIEREFEKDNCVVSQVFHAIWLYEHKMEFSIQELIDKFLKILKNVYAFEFKDDQHLSLLLFVLKNVQKCLSTFENFQIFVKQLNELNLNSKVMDALESWKHRLEAKGMAKGLAKGKAESVLNVAKSLLKMGLFPLENIAEATNLSLGKLKELQASLQ